MNSIMTIEGLTTRQRVLADLIWSCEDETALNTLITSLPTTEDRAHAATLVKLIIHESLEQEGNLAQFCDLADACIAQARGML